MINLAPSPIIPHVTKSKDCGGLRARRDGVWPSSQPYGHNVTRRDGAGGCVASGPRP